MLKGLILLTSGFSILATILPFIPSQVWWIRVFDFPRLQVVTIALLSAFGCFLVLKELMGPELFILIALIICIIYQSIKILPYTFLYPKKVLKAYPEDNHKKISLLVTNVLMTNRESSRCLAMIRKADPDVVLAVETDKWWEKELKPLEEHYPYHSYAPWANTYGMLLFSKLKLEECEIKYLLDHEIPSVHCLIQLAPGVSIKFFGVHPKPPSPGESNSSAPRDAELVLVGKEARSTQLPVIVAGDLNDVAWSHTTHLFQKISGLLDPREGRGLYSTYNAKYPLLRWPLDHIFHSNHFKLIDLKRLEQIGSDHFPIFIHLSYEPDAQDKQPTPEPEKANLDEAKVKLKKVK